MSYLENELKQAHLENELKQAYKEVYGSRGGMSLADMEFMNAVVKLQKFHVFHQLKFNEIEDIISIYNKTKIRWNVRKENSGIDRFLYDEAIYNLRGTSVRFRLTKQDEDRIKEISFRF